LRLEEMTEAVPSSRKTIQRRELGSDCVQSRRAP
jgi:hypothetical protein